VGAFVVCDRVFAARTSQAKNTSPTVAKVAAPVMNHQEDAL
jgi:hypothetical protein